MKRISLASLVLLLMGIVLLAGCLPVAPQPAAGPAAASPATLAATRAAEVTPDTLNTITRVESSPRLIFSAGTPSQPAAVGNGLYRVGTIEVTGPDTPGQTLDVVMDQPNSEWLQLPLATDDLNFDGLPDLVITQPVGARWGRLHAWLLDPASRRFVTNTLTAELSQLRVGSYRLDPATKTIRIANALGMTPFEAAYQTADGHLVPVFPPAMPVDAGACPAKTPGMLLLHEERHQYCLLYPEGFEASRPHADEVVIGQPGSEGHSPQAFIRVEVQGEKTVEQIADELVAAFAQLTPQPGRDGGSELRRSRGTLAGGPAVILDSVPGQDLRRMVLLSHQGKVYELTFVPADLMNEAYTQMEALFAAVTGSLRFLPAGSGQPAQPAAAPAAATPAATGAAGQLVFSSARSGHLELYALPISASTGATAPAQAAARQLTRHAGWAGFPLVAPGGASVAYVVETRNADGSPADREIYLLALDGSQPINLTRNPALDYDPAWSADGRQLAFVSSRGGDNRGASIYVLDVAAALASGGSAGARLIAANGSAPAWSPDGRRIAYISDKDTPGQAQLYVTGAGGGDVQRLTGRPKAGNGAGVGRPAWSPDGTQIALAADWEGNREIYLLPVAPGAAPVNLTRNPGYDDFPQWSPDGKRLAFISDRAGQASLYVADADGAGARAVAPGLSAALASWSPDGLRLAFVGTGQDLNQDIYVVNSDGTGLTAMTHDPAQDTFPAWAAVSK